MNLFEFLKSPSQPRRPKGRDRPPPGNLSVDENLLRKHVEALCNVPGGRAYNNQKGLEESAKYIRATFRSQGYRANSQPFRASGRVYQNLIASYGPKQGRRIVVGAHFDAVTGCPGADDNASGVAGVLELARILKQRKPQVPRRIDLVAYCLEEPPFFGTSEMGSSVHARSLEKLNVEVDLMISLEMIGCFTDSEGSQQFPVPALKYIYPNVGNFIAVVGDLKSVSEVNRVKMLMRKNSKIDVQSITAPRSIPGVDLSDHRCYWDCGYPAVMLTDTAFYRNPQYHRSGDTPETLNYKKMKEVVEGVYGVVTNY
jgi:hypothetical protein